MDGRECTPHPPPTPPMLVRVAAHTRGGAGGWQGACPPHRTHRLVSGIMTHAPHTPLRGGQGPPPPERQGPPPPSEGFLQGPPQQPPQRQGPHLRRGKIPTPGSHQGPHSTEAATCAEQHASSPGARAPHPQWQGVPTPLLEREAGSLPGSKGGFG